MLEGVKPNAKTKTMAIMNIANPIDKAQPALMLSRMGSIKELQMGVFPNSVLILGWNNSVSG